MRNTITPCSYETHHENNTLMHFIIQLSSLKKYRLRYYENYRTWTCVPAIMYNVIFS